MITSNQVIKLLVPHGTCKPQSASQWLGSIVLPPAIACFYEEVGPVDINIPGYGNSSFLPKLSSLWNRQAGYRWNAKTTEVITDWHSDWIVVADEGADPYIHFEGKIMFAYHGAGKWKPANAYADINTMAACLAVLGSVILEADDDFTNDNCDVRPKYKREAILRITDILGKKQDAKAAVERAGWG
jgi:hypothetical protein